MKQEIRELLAEIRIPEKTILAIENTTAIEIIKDEENILKVKISKDIAYDLYCEEFLDNAECSEVNLLDVVYSACEENAFDRAYKFAGYHSRRMSRDDYESHITGHQTCLVCYILTKVNDYKYSKLKSIYDVTEPVPFQIYRKLINKSKEKIEVCAVNSDGIEYAGQLSEIEIMSSMMGVKIVAFIDIISKAPNKYVKGEIGIQIFPKPFVKDLEDIGLTALTEKKKKELTRAGAEYVRLTKKPLYCECHGEAYSRGWMGDVRHRVDSRVMIDINAFKLLNPSVPNDWFIGVFNRSAEVGEDVPEHLLWMCSPVVFGFSFGNKAWCRMLAKDIQDIKFSENAFDDLIIPQENKDIFVASLTHDMPSLDAISDKGAGKIFLLYGAPGVGKTMTAESVAEFLQKPLYFVSVGELGVKPEELEHSLNKVMKVATSWDAIILLDEVDVFAVKRDGASIERNAMTAIFLRMLERYSGVMFMTTNLLNNLDDAFISRATAVIKYNDLETADRIKIWNGLFDKVEKLGEVKISPSLRMDINKVASYNLNGRIIKNIVRLAYSLALSKGEDLSLNHIETALDLRQC